MIPIIILLSLLLTTSIGINIYFFTNTGLLQSIKLQKDNKAYVNMRQRMFRYRKKYRALILAVNEVGQNKNEIYDEYYSNRKASKLDNKNLKPKKS